MYQPNSFLKKAVESGDIEMVREALAAIIQADPAFQTSNLHNAIAYVQEHGLDPFETENDPDLPIDRSGNWEPSYFASTVTYLRHNFTQERLNHVREVGQKTHPVSTPAEIHAAASQSRQEVEPPKKAMDRRRIPWGLLGALLLLAVVLLIVFIHMSKSVQAAQAAQAVQVSRICR